MRTFEFVMPMTVVLLAWPSWADDFAARMAAQQAEQARQSQQRLMSQRLEQQRLSSQQYSRQLDNRRYDAALVQRHQQQATRQQAEARDQLRRDAQTRELLARPTPTTRGARPTQETTARRPSMVDQRTTWVALGPADSSVVLSGRNDFATTALPDSLKTTLTNARARNDELRSVSLGRRGEWALVRNERELDSHGLPPEVRTAINDDVRRGDRLDLVSFVGEAVVVVTDRDLFVSGSLPSALERALGTAKRESGGVRSVAMSDDAWVVVDAHGAVHSSSAALANSSSDLRPARLVALSPRGDWVRVQE